jgi:hypothetical protein
MTAKVQFLQQCSEKKQFLSTKNNLPGFPNMGKVGQIKGNLLTDA